MISLDTYQKWSGFTSLTPEQYEFLVQVNDLLEFAQPFSGFSMFAGFIVGLLVCVIVIAIKLG